MNLDEIKQILELVEEHQLAELEVEQDGLKIRIRKDTGLPPMVTRAAGAPATQPSAGAGAAPILSSGEIVELAAASSPSDEELRETESVELAVVKSPIVGTFYRSAEPGSKPLVEIGDSVRNGQVLCIIEAMKLMNEIESEYEGEVVTAYIENGQPVQYGERLFAIKTR